jgi:hypothetical protein
VREFDTFQSGDALHEAAMTTRPDGTRAWRSSDRIGIAAAAAVAVTIGATFVGRPGYGPDEEITWFAVEGIKAHGIPTLPSGLAYFRGPSYSYLAWLSNLVGGPGFEAYRWLGVFCLAAVVIAAATLARSLFDRGTVAAWLIALAPAAAASGAYARFYMPFAAVCTLTLVAAARMRDSPRHRALFVAGCVAARSLHEFGMLLALVPAAGWLCAESSGERRSFSWLLLITAAALLAEHALLLWLPCVAWNCEGATWGFTSSGLPAITGTALPVAAYAMPAEIISAIVVTGMAAGASYRTIRADAVFTVAAAGAAALFANGVVAALVVLWLIARPDHAGRVVKAGLFASIAGSIAWIALIAIRSNALVDARFIWGLLQGSVAFPWSGIQFLAVEQPVAAAAMTLGVWRGGFARPGRHTVPARTLAVLLYLELLSFGVTGMDVRSRFLVLILPLIAVFTGVGILWLAGTLAEALSRKSDVTARVVALAIAIVGVGYVSTEQASAIFPHRDPAPGDTWRTKWSPPVSLSSLDADREIAPDDLIVTNDELAALLVFGKVDFWWPPDPESAARYAFIDRRGGQFRGLYGGAAVLSDLSQLRVLVEDRRTRGVVVALFNTGKFGFDPSTLRALIDENETVELEERPHDWFVARFPPRR